MKTMKTFSIAALFLCAISFGVKAQETVYAEDKSQGYLLNDFSSNWFWQIEVGGNLLMTPGDTKESFAKRIQPQVELNVGKWFAPVMGLRVSIGGARFKGATAGNSMYALDSEACGDNRFMHEAFYKLNGGIDVMLNLTNWWCGYDAGRRYNATLYGGFMVNIPFYHDDDGLHRRGGNNFGLRVGVLNSFAVSKRVDLLIDLRYGADEMRNEGRNVSHAMSAMVGVSYKFGKRSWRAPVVPICPVYNYSDKEGDDMAKRLQAADSKIRRLERKLDECISTPVESEAIIDVEESPMAVIYFQLGSAEVQGVQNKVVKAIANAILSTDDNYVLVGWADNYTGTETVNAKLRKDRVENVKKLLVAHGVDANRLEIKTNDGNLTEFGENSATLNRAVTVSVAQ